VYLFFVAYRVVCCIVAVKDCHLHGTGRWKLGAVVSRTASGRSVQYSSTLEKGSFGEILRIRTRASPKNLNNRKVSTGQSGFRHGNPPSRRFKEGKCHQHGQQQCTQSRLLYCLRESSLIPVVNDPLGELRFRTCSLSKSFHCRNFRTSQSDFPLEECPRLERARTAPTRFFDTFNCQYHFLNSVKISLANHVVLLRVAGGKSSVEVSWDRLYSSSYKKDPLLVFKFHWWFLRRKDDTKFQRSAEHPVFPCRLSTCKKDYNNVQD
jgi:hypothetical protein